MARRRGVGSGNSRRDDSPSLADVRGWAASEELERIASYVRAGRQYASLSDAEVPQRWSAAVRAMATDPDDERHRRLERDLHAELRLRKIPAPLEAVSEALQVFAASMRAAYEATKNDPEALAQSNEAFRRDLNAFKADRDRSKN